MSSNIHGKIHGQKALEYMIAIVKKVNISFHDAESKKNSGQLIMH